MAAGWLTVGLATAMTAAVAMVIMSGVVTGEAADDPAKQVEPGMSLEEVVAILGEPAEHGSRDEATRPAAGEGVIEMAGLGSVTGEQSGAIITARTYRWSVGRSTVEVELLNDVVVNKVVRPAS
jgi:hypothetical protein